MADIGMVGLGVMGANLSLNMAEKGYSVAVYNRTPKDRRPAHRGHREPLGFAADTSFRASRKAARHRAAGRAGPRRS